MKKSVSIFILICSCCINLVFANTWSQTSYDDFNAGYLDNTSPVGIGNGATIYLSRANWYNENWAYRIPITIYNSTSTLNSFQVFISTKDMGSSTLAAIRTAGKTNSDYSDIIFVDGSNNKINNYWITPSTINPNGVWLKIPTISTGTSTVFMYYGNTSATTPTSNIDNTLQKVSTITAFGTYDARLGALYNFDEGSGPTVSDLSANGNDGTLNGGIIWAGSDGGTIGNVSTSTIKFSGNALNFDGIDDYVSCGNTGLGSTSTVSIVAWIYIDPAKNNTANIVTKNGGYYQNQYSMMWSNNDKRISSGFNGKYWLGSSATNSVYVANWYQVAMTYGKNYINYYVNGAASGSSYSLSIATLAYTTNIIRIGRVFGGGDDSFQGTIDDVAIYTEVISSGEIKAQYERRKYADPEPTVALGSEVPYSSISGAYVSNGSFTSSSNDSSSVAGVSWDSILWSPTNQPVGTSLKFQIATSNDNKTWVFRGPDGALTTYYTTASGQSIWTGHTGDRYLKYKIYFSGDGIFTPEVHYVTISYTPVATEISGVVDSGKADDSLDIYYAKLSIPANTITRNVEYTITKRSEPSISVLTAPMKPILSYDIEAKDSVSNELLSTLGGAITLTMRCKATKGSDGIYYVDNTYPALPLSEASKLAIHYWDGARWQLVGGTVSVDENTVTITTKISHLAEYSIAVKSTIVSSKRLTVTYNIFTPSGPDSRYGEARFVFANENSEVAELKIYSISAKLIRTVTATEPGISWDGRNESGDICESGVYIYQLKLGTTMLGKGTVVLAK
ncbi:MAG: DUF2341 domain-containing protein [Elusimicrobia bacterium]|nr:DUF2341 domain-containing protein [Elusimicrobiota bacterium]